MTNAPKKPPDFEVIGEKYEDAGSFNERAKAFFRRRAGVELTDEDVREIVQNLMQLFDLLEAAEVQEESELAGMANSEDGAAKEDTQHEREQT